MESDTIAHLSIRELATHLRTHTLTSTEVTCVILDRIHRMNPRLHAYLTIMEESALRSAKRADVEIRAGYRRGELHGIPVAVKDLCLTQGVLTTCGSGVLREWRPDSSATVVERLEAAGPLF